MKMNDKTFISLVRKIISDTEVDATNNERNILIMARNRATPKPSRLMSNPCCRSIPMSIGVLKYLKMVILLYIQTKCF